MVKKPKVIVIIGPTSSGKSDLSITLARRFNGEVVSADSRQVYRGLDIGSGKVPRDNSKIKNKKSKLQFKNQNYFYKGVKHYLLDVANPKKIFTVAQYQKLAKKALNNIIKSGKVPIICGGTGLYVDSLIYNWPIPEVKANTKLRTKLYLQSAEKLFKTLQKLDPERAKNIDKHNKVRLVRAIEIIKATRGPVPYFKPYESKTSPYEILKIGLRPKETLLKEKIKIRLLKRIRIGMIGEVKNLKENGVSSKKLESLGLEYRYVNRYLEGQINKDQMVEELTRQINQYTKRQMTWFKRDKSTIWLNVPEKAFSKVQDFLFP